MSVEGRPRLLGSLILLMHLAPPPGPLPPAALDLLIFQISEFRCDPSLTGENLTSGGGGNGTFSSLPSLARGLPTCWPAQHPLILISSSPPRSNQQIL